MEKEWWNKAIKHLEAMPMEEFAKLVEKVDEVKIPFTTEDIEKNIVLPAKEKKCSFHNAIERIKKQGFVKESGQNSFEDFLHRNNY